MPTDAKRYHHGDLRSALLTAALEVLERDGPGALSLRALARAVGVSPMAPYHHFKDRTALLAAVAAAGFEQLYQRKIRTGAAHPSVQEALAAGAADYVRFVLESPNLYRLMKGPEFADRERYPDLHVAAAAPSRVLLELLKALLAANDLKTPTAEQGAQLLWGLAHGIGMLALDCQLPSAIAATLARDGATAMIEGWLKR